MKLLITGGAGYLGTELCLRLMPKEWINSIRIYDNLSRDNFNFFLGPDKLHEKVSFVEADILDSHTLKKEVAKSDLVIHLAAKVTTPFSDHNPHLFDQVNHWGTAELSYALEDSDCQKVIYLSSAGVYGASEEEVGKGFEPNPKTFYGISKLKGEAHLRRLEGKKDVAIIRCANVYGYSKSMRFDAVINRFVFQAKNFGRITIHGNGDQSRAFIHISRVIDFLENLLQQKRFELHYDLVDRNLSVNDIAYTLKEILPEMEMLYVDQQLRLREIRVRKDPGVTTLIGEPKTSLEEDLRKFWSQMA